MVGEGARELLRGPRDEGLPAPRPITVNGPSADAREATSGPRFEGRGGRVTPCRSFEPKACRLGVELGLEQRDDVVGIGVAPEHRLLEDELAVEVDVEDPARAGHDLDGPDVVLEVLEQPRRQTGGVRERPSGDAVLDPDMVL
jgi:hypothetical protein